MMASELILSMNSNPTAVPIGRRIEGRAPYSYMLVFTDGKNTRFEKIFMFVQNTTTVCPPPPHVQSNCYIPNVQTRFFALRLDK